MNDKDRDRDFLRSLRALADATATLHRAMDYEHRHREPPGPADRSDSPVLDEVDDLLNNVGLRLEDARGLVRNLRKR